MKDWYLAKELIQFKGLPTTVQGIRKAAQKQGWLSRKCTGTKALEYAFKSLPTETQNAIRQEATQAVLAEVRLPVCQEQQLQLLETAAQSLVTDARTGVVNAIENLMKTTGYTQTRCAQLLIDMARAGQVEPYVIAMLKSARDGRGRQSTDGLPSARSLLRFIARAEIGDLTPTYRQKDMTIPVWVKPFLSFYQQPTKPTVQSAYEQFLTIATKPVPSIHQVRRFLSKMGNVSREVGRMGSHELRNIQPFIRRDTSQLLPTDIYTADGHCFDAEIRHPIHGRPFRPEITCILDVATRKAVGWSIDLAESALAVLSAVRYSCVHNGIPAIFYVDNGSGYKNAMMKDEGVGLMARIGTQMMHSMPYNSQAKGLIERSHKTIWINLARKLNDYVGVDMDRQARLQNYKISRKAIAQAKHIKVGEVIQLTHLSFEEFIEICAQAVNEYNNRPHKSLGKITDPNTGRQRHMSPNECWAMHEEKGFVAEKVTDDEARPLFRPQVARVINRCEINLFNNRYFSKALYEFHGEQLHIGYDVHDVERVWVYDQSGAFLCTAVLNGNSRNYVPLSVAEQGRDNRLKGREQRLMNRLEEVHAERYGACGIELEKLEIAGLGTLDMSQLRKRASEVEQVVEAEFEPITVTATKAFEVMPAINPIPATPAARWQLWNEINQQQKDLNTLGENVARWFINYPNGSEFKTFSRRNTDAQLQA